MTDKMQDDRDHIVLTALRRAAAPVCLSNLADQTGCEYDVAAVALQRLKRHGKVRFVTKSKGGPGWIACTRGDNVLVSIPIRDVDRRAIRADQGREGYADDGEVADFFLRHGQAILDDKIHEMTEAKDDD